MRILFMVGLFPKLSETFILNQITGLIDRGHHVDVYASKPGDCSVVHSDVEKYNLANNTYYWNPPQNRLLRFFHRFSTMVRQWLKDPLLASRILTIVRRRPSLATIRLLFTAIDLLSRPHYDIIHCHFGPTGERGRRLRDSGILPGKLITTFHGSDLTSYVRKNGQHCFDSLFQAGDLFLPISERWKRRLIDLGCDQNKIIVHRMGVDCKKFLFTRRKLNDRSKIRLVSIARLTEKKGLEYGIRAVAKLARVNPNIEYTIVGDGSLKGRLQSLVKELDLIDTVRMVGSKSQNEVIEILEKSHILVAPSVTSKNGDQEGIPVGLMEAMAMGLPIVSTLHSGIPELIENGVSGFLVPGRNIDRLFAKLKYLVEHPEIWPDMGRHGRKHVEEHYDINKLNDRLVQIYRRSLKRPALPRALT